MNLQNSTHKPSRQKAILAVYDWWSGKWCHYRFVFFLLKISTTSKKETISENGRKTASFRDNLPGRNCIKWHRLAFHAWWSTPKICYSRVKKNPVSIKCIFPETDWVIIVWNVWQVYWREETRCWRLTYLTPGWRFCRSSPHFPFPGICASHFEHWKGERKRSKLKNIELVVYYL